MKLSDVIKSDDEHCVAVVVAVIVVVDVAVVVAVSGTLIVLSLYTVDFTMPKKRNSMLIVLSKYQRV